MIFPTEQNLDCKTQEKPQFYRLLARQIGAVISDVRDLTANLANTSALLYDAMPDVNWAGFYLVKNGVLILGPFQGKAACVEIAPGRGVCGTALACDRVQLVENVHEFPGHIACDSASNSEIVLPIHRNGRVMGVLDIDSPDIGRFDEEDREGLLKIVAVLENWLDECKEESL